MSMIFLNQPVGMNCPNTQQDVSAISAKLKEIGKIPFITSNVIIMDDIIIKGITELQRHFMAVPDAVISPGGPTLNFLSNWEIKHICDGVDLDYQGGRLREAWNWVNPLLPKGSYCSSGYRSISEQRRILHDYYIKKCSQNDSKFYKNYVDRINKYRHTTSTIKERKETESLDSHFIKMVRVAGIIIAVPGSSPHQHGKAVDISGVEDFLLEHYKIVKLVASAHPELFSGKVIDEAIKKNKHNKIVKSSQHCVHFEIN